MQICMWNVQPQVGGPAMLDGLQHRHAESCTPPHPIPLILIPGYHKTNSSILQRPSTMMFFLPLCIAANKVQLLRIQEPK